MPQLNTGNCWLTYDKVPGRSKHQGAGESHSIQGEAGWSDPQTAVVEQPNEATTQAEVDRPAVRYDTIMALQEQGFDKWFIVEAEFSHWGPGQPRNRCWEHMLCISK